MNEIATNKVKVLRPNVKDIITVRGNWTKGKSYFYLVDFVDPEKDWVSGYRIIPGIKSSYAFEGLYIPPAYTASKVDALHTGGYVNVFTGRTSINISSIFELVSTLTDDIFYRIIAMDLSVRLGNWSRDDEGKYTIKEVSIPITLNVKASSIIKNMVSKQETKESNAKQSQKRLQRKSSDDQTANMITEEIIEHYKSLASGNERLDYIFELFGNGDVVSPNMAYTTIFNHKGKYSIRATSIVLNREQFMFAVEDTAESIAARNDIRKFDGTVIEKMSLSTARNIQYKAKKLYYGGEKTSVSKVTDETENKTLDLFDKGHSIQSISSSVGISYDTVRKILIKHGKLEKRKTDRVNMVEYLSNLASIVKADAPELYAKYRNDIIDIQKSAIFIGNHENLLGVLTSDKIGCISELKEYNGNIDTLRFTAIRCKCFAFVYEASYLFPEYLLTHDTKFISLFIVDRNKKISNMVTIKTANMMQKLAAVKYSEIKFDVPVESLANEDRKPDDPYRLLHEYLVYFVNKVRTYKGRISDSSSSKFINSRFGIPNSYIEYYGEHYRNIQ